MNLDVDEIQARIKNNEGLRLKAYWDSESILTLGWGHNLVAKPISKQAAEQIFRDDFADAYMDFLCLGDSVKWLSPTRAGVIIEMLFQLGMTRFKGFVRMNNALETKDCERVVKEMVQSLWAEQCPKRANELAVIFYDDE